MKKILLFILIMTATLTAKTYEYNYSVVVDTNKTQEESVKDFYMYGSFDEIIRYEMIVMDSSFNEDNQAIYDKALETIKKYTNEAKEIKVTIIGHTNANTDDHNEMVVDSDVYANKIQNIFRYSLDKNESKELSKHYADEIKQKFLDDNVSDSLLDVEYRGANDLGFSDATGEGEDLSNRVMVSIYVLAPKELDSDKDGIFDKYDLCPETLFGLRVDKDGCPLDSDGDGVFDFEDRCPKTPKGVKVNVSGCPLDSDGDGVADYKDNCKNTPAGMSVDVQGCPIKKNLALNFQRNSDKILKESYPKVLEFAAFLNKHPYYNATIIGHTDSRGKASTNMDLSKRRADSVKKALVAEGIAQERLSTIGKGEIEPIQSNVTPEGRKANRRIEVKLSLIQN